MKKCSGFTLTELVIVLVIAGIMVAIGMPQFNNMVKDNRRAAEVNRFVTTINLARTEALKRRSAVVMCKSAGGVDCEPGASWEDGWIIFQNRVDETPPDRDEAAVPPNDEPLIKIAGAVGNSITVTGFGDYPDFIRFAFDGYPWPGNGGRVNFCDDRGVAFARAVIITTTGRAQLSTDTDADGIHEDESNNDLTC